jgi:ABC-2 type transport system permease protein
MLNVLVSILIGATCGLFSRNVQSSTAIAVPVAFVIGFLPMFASFNENIYNVARWIYATQFSFLTIDFSVDLLEPLLITGGNLVVFAVIFAVVYRMRGLARG